MNIKETLTLQLCMSLIYVGPLVSGLLRSTEVYSSLIKEMINETIMIPRKSFLETYKARLRMFLPPPPQKKLSFINIYL